MENKQANHIGESNEMVTAVEWLIEEIHKNMEFIPVHIQEQAKAMEKEQHGKTWDDALAQVEKRTVWARAMCDFDEYYNETYKK